MSVHPSPIRVSTHQIHHEASRFFLLGPEKYFDRVERLVKTPTKKASALLWLAFLAEARDLDSAYAEFMLQASGIMKSLGRHVSISLVWSRKHRCTWDGTELDRWLANQLPAMNRPNHRTI